MKPIFYSTLLLLLSSCAAQHSRNVGHVLHMCDLLAGPDAGKANGEVAFWFDSERTATSRKLWSAGGIKAIDAQLAITTEKDKRVCLTRLRQEAVTHKVVYE